MATNRERMYLGRFDDWIKSIARSRSAENILNKFAIIFVLRDWVKENKCIDQILHNLETNQIKVLSIYELNEIEISKFLSMSRGGNWTRGCREEINGGAVCNISL